MTDSEGYTFKVSYDFNFNSAFTPDISNAAPGFVNLISNTAATVNVLNTTPGRNYSAPAYFIIYGLYGYDSLPCTLNRQAGSGSENDPGVSYAGLTYCSLPLSFNIDPDGLALDLGPNEASGNLLPPDYLVTVPRVPEEQADAAAAAYMMPAYFALAAHVRNTSSFVSYCSVTRNSYGADGEIVFASTPATPGCTQ